MKKNDNSIDVFRDLIKLMLLGNLINIHSY